MSFTRGLYYPHINIENPAWLRTALLYWETIETVVPGQVTKPYEGSDQEACADAGILMPLRAAQYPDALERAGALALEYSENKNAKSIVNPHSNEISPYAEKMSGPMRNWLSEVTESN